MIEDFDLIVSSILTQYGIRIYSKDFREMRWDEFKALLCGLSADTPLGRIVSIRAEDDKDVLKNFTKDQMRIRSEWRNKAAKKVPAPNAETFYGNMKQMFINMAGGGEKNGR